VTRAEVRDMGDLNMPVRFTIANVNDEEFQSWEGAMARAEEIVDSKMRSRTHPIFDSRCAAALVPRLACRRTTTLRVLSRSTYDQGLSSSGSPSVPCWPPDRVEHRDRVEVVTPLRDLAVGDREH
jgi:hypothetical protein